MSGQPAQGGAAGGKGHSNGDRVGESLWQKEGLEGFGVVVEEVRGGAGEGQIQEYQVVWVPSGWGRRLGEERDRSLLEGSRPQKGGTWPRAPPSHLALQPALCTLIPTCCQMQDAPRDVLSLHGSRDTDTRGREHKVPGYIGRHGYPVHAHHQPSTSLLTPPPV